MQQPDALQARRIILIQAVVGLALVAIALPFGRSVALSALLGAGICLLANTLFAAWVFRSYRAQEPGRLTLRIYSAEIAKLGLILGLFTAAFVALDGLYPLALLGAYLVAQIAPILIAAQMELGRTESKRRLDGREAGTHAGSRITK